MTTVVLLTRDADLIGELQAAFAAHAPQLTVVTQDDARASTATVAALCERNARRIFGL